ncbi:hypothetical protein Ait01nite_058980 [Actinoplanes italicus]|uniref:Response regulator receiver domain-containing protein n=1 Tax=Actinoplanes italicus TaxID=113567 RepID=A0A2T0K632_9ACTN|nr:response regulator [Actinoplanes italicus]PRX18441.1 response regulator receiver domain-containing protein [Actinoplanes italicus]GIE32853.1 hypothetical protein Ait01nite_058980 [Actinoplanes italicus]
MRTVPTTSPPDRPGATPHSRGAACAPYTDARSILLGEPHPDLRAIFTRLLRRAGHHVDDACDAAAIIDTARRMQPDLIIINLQELGAPTCRALRATFGTDTTPVILLSTTLRLDARTAAKAGANTYLELPAHTQTLLYRVRILLEKPDWSDLPP